MGFVMSYRNLLLRAWILSLLLTAALVSSGCINGGVGLGADYPARWGSGATGPPIFVGGPTN